jgi:type VI secretion system protein ImpL
MTLQVFSEDQVSGSSPFYAATGAASRFRSGFDGGKADDIFWNIFAGPLDFLWTYARNETSSSIQQQWEETVLQEVQGASNQQAMQHLLSQDGPVWKFVKGPAAPFLGWRAGKGYYSKTALGGSLPFDPAFFTFLAKGSSARIAAPERQDYQVGIRGLPTDANADARTKPQSTRLELQCSSGSQVLENLNFPVSRKFLWSPDACSDVVLRIDVGNLVLTKKYSGAEGFPAFLRSFRGGMHTFRPADFPAEKKSLERLGIRFIKVNYRFTGDGAVTGKAGALPGQAPGTIVRCWE